MTVDKWLVLIFSGGLVALIYWFFLSKREEKGEVSTQINITVSGGYSPATVYIPVNTPSQITFLRTDPSSCLEEVVIPDLKIKKNLPLNQSVTIPVTLTGPGEYPFHCGMDMFHGKIVAKPV